MVEPVGLPPEFDFSFNAGVYRCAWNLLGITVTVDRLRQGSEHTTAEMVVRSRIKGHLHHARVNLTSTTAKKSLTKELDERDKGEGWADIIETVCVKVLEAVRRGEPVIDLDDVEPTERLRWRMEPIIMEGEANLWYAPGGTGKSVMASLCAVLIQGGSRQDGLWLDSEPGNVLYLDWETNKSEVATRARMLSCGLSAPTPKIRYRFCVQPLADDIEAIQRAVLEYEIDVVIVDSAGSAIGGETEGKAERILAYFNALRSLKKTTLTIDHTNKEGSLYGNAYKWNQSRNIWELKRSEESGDDVTAFGMIHRKINNGSLQKKPLGFQFIYEEEAIRVQRMNLNALPDIARHMPLRMQIIEALKHGAASASEIAEEIQGDESSIRVTLNRGKDTIFVKVTENRWGLLENSFRNNRNAVTPNVTVPPRNTPPKGGVTNGGGNPEVSEKVGHEPDPF